MRLRHAAALIVAAVVGASVWWNASRSSDPLASSTTTTTTTMAAAGCSTCPSTASPDAGATSVDLRPTTAEALADLGFETGELTDLPMAMHEPALVDAAWIRRQPRGRTV
ncbi:MAG: hypothetical protein H0V63_12430, partial [Burkholderiaceae bacterium]|nr:hypothetical protein [Burkholderiaceae bacterium]